MDLTDLGRSVTPIFLSMDQIIYRVSTSCEKMKKIYRVEVLIFAKRSMTFRSFDLFMPLKGSRFVKMMAIFEIINATDSYIQNIIRIICLC